MDIPAHDHGKLYVFDIDGDLAKQLGPNEIAARIGLEALNTDFVDVVSLTDLAEGSSSPLEYLWQGYAMELSADEEAALDAAQTHLLIIMSRAFGGTPAQLQVTPGITHLVTLTAEPAAPNVDTLTSTASSGVLNPAEMPPVMDEPPTSRVWLYALIVIFGFFGLMAWRIAAGAV